MLILSLNGADSTNQSFSFVNVVLPDRTHCKIISGAKNLKLECRMSNSISGPIVRSAHKQRCKVINMLDVNINITSMHAGVVLESFI